MDNRQLIMNSALTLFYESGYDAVGVQQIVDSAGVSKPTLYYYFGSKQGLLEALLNEHFQPMEQKLIEASETGKNIPEKLYRIARAFFNGASEDPKFHMLMMALFYSGRKSEGFRTVYPMIDRFYHLCVDVFDNASAELGNMNGRQEQFAVGFSGILMHYLMMTAGDQSDLSNLVVRDEEVYRLVHQFMYGIYRFSTLEQWLPHIADLGCTAIYIGPLFESTTHGYDTKDYKQVDRRLGDNADFAAYVKKAHELGIKVVVDGVFNHTGREFFAFRDIQEKREQSPYCGWYKGIWFGGNTCYNDGFSYEAWRNCFELVNLNLQNQQVRDYLLDVIDFWIDEFDIDGIRLDCADCLDFGFMEQMRARTSAKKQDFWLMGEVIHGDYARYIGDGQHLLHSVTNYELHKGLYSGHNDHNYFEIAHMIRREFDENGGIYKGKKLYSFVDNHDVDRLASKLNVKENMIPIYALLYFLPGIPSIYYGSEFGIEGRKEGGNDDPLRPALNLEELEKNPPAEKLPAWIKTLSDVRKKHPAARTGRYRELMLTNRQYAFARLDETDALITAVNNDENQSAGVWIPASCDGTWKNAVTGEAISPENGKLFVEVPPCGCVLIEKES